MKFFFTATIATLVGLVAATPTHLVKRASPDDTCDIGYASTNGG
jgi:pectate lyase